MTLDGDQFAGKIRSLLNRQSRLGGRDFIDFETYDKRTAELQIEIDNLVLQRARIIMQEREATHRKFAAAARQRKLERLKAGLK